MPGTDQRTYRCPLVEGCITVFTDVMAVVQRSQRLLFFEGDKQNILARVEARQVMHVICPLPQLAAQQLRQH